MERAQAKLDCQQCKGGGGGGGGVVLGYAECLSTWRMCDAWSEI